MQSSVEVFEPAEGYGATVQPAAASRNWRGAAALKLAVLALAVVAVLAVSGIFTSSNQEVVLGGGNSLKTIDTLLAHIDKITKDAKSGHAKDQSVKKELLGSSSSDSSDDDQDSGAPKAVRKGLGHVNKALEAAQAADASLDQGIDVKDNASEEKKKRAIADKMRALTAQIQGDFQKVTGFGKGAGFVPPVVQPHM